MTNRAAFAACPVFAVCQFAAISVAIATAADQAGSTRSGTTNQVCMAERSRNWMARDNLGAECRRAAAAAPAVCVPPPGWPGLE